MDVLMYDDVIIVYWILKDGKVILLLYVRFVTFTRRVNEGEERERV